MKPIRVTYRAVFRQPIGPLNPMNLKMPVSMTIELYEAPGKRWKARECDTGKKRPIEPAGESANLQSAQEAVKGLFQECLLPWQMWGDPSMAIPVELIGEPRYKPGLRVIQPEEVEIRDGKVYFKLPEVAKK